MWVAAVYTKDTNCMKCGSRLDVVTCLKTRWWMSSMIVQLQGKGVCHKKRMKVATQCPHLQHWFQILTQQSSQGSGTSAAVWIEHLIHLTVNFMSFRPHLACFQVGWLTCFLNCNASATVIGCNRTEDDTFIAVQLSDLLQMGECGFDREAQLADLNSRWRLLYSQRCAKFCARPTTTWCALQPWQRVSSLPGWLVSPTLFSRELANSLLFFNGFQN